MPFDEKTPFMVGGQAQVGPPLLSIDYVAPGWGMPPTTTVGGASRSLTPPSVSEQLLLTLVQEIQGLRQDLADRTLAGRLRRFWNWLERVLTPSEDQP